jgi:hypothetical protein
MRIEAKCPKCLWPSFSISFVHWWSLKYVSKSDNCLYLLVILGVFLAPVLGARALAQGNSASSGALPSGELSEIDMGKVTAPPEKKNERPVECTDFVANPLGLPMEYERAGAFVWWLARIKGKAPEAQPTRAPSEAKGTSDKPRYVLYNLDIQKRTATPRAAIELVEPFAMMLRKNAVSIVSFQQAGSGRCLDGPGTLVDLSINKKNEGAVQQLGSYSILASPRERMLFDKTRQAIVETDPVSGQKRLLRKLNDGEKPIYFDPTSKKLLVYVQGKNDKNYVTYSSDKSKELGREKLPANTKYVFTPNGSKIALEIRGSENAFKIHELSSWNGAGSKGVYKITLPKGVSPHDARIDIDPGTGLALVTGESLATRESWQRVFVFRYRMSKLLTTLSFDGTQYPNLAAISPKGDTIFVEVRSSLTKSTVGGRIYDVSSGKIKMININLPPG